MSRGAFFVVLFGLLALASGSALAQNTPTCPTPAARVVAVQGQVTVGATRTAGRPVQNGDGVCFGETIFTGSDSRANVVLGASDAVTQLDQNSTLVVGCKPTNPSLTLLEGIIHIFTHQDNGLQVCTQFVNAGIRGTEFRVETRTAAYPQSTRITVFEGIVATIDVATSVEITAGRDAEFGVGGQLLRISLGSRDSLQWALYYPPLFIGNEPGIPPDLRAVLDRRREGDFKGALDALRRIAPAKVGAGIYAIVKAELLLAVGRYDELQATLRAAGQLETTDGLALRSVAALTQGDTAGALQLAQAAVARDSRSGPAVIALSYALQATGDQAAARDVLLAASQAQLVQTRTLAAIGDATLVPSLSQGQAQDGLVLARLAEVYLSLGERSKSVDAAARAVMIAPDLGRAITVRGFANLAVTRIADARNDFLTAMKSEPHDPLPRLGLGLAIIRQGDLAGGLRELEIAKSLDPGNSLVASYLGKGYYEARMDKASGTELSVAKQLDPNDPTPYLYDAVRKQANNAPVLALRDIETSIALNDNRAVFRSRLLLDEDLAVRAATAASIYRDLGFQQPSLVEAYKSIAYDQANFSAHRFLADSYIALPLHEMGRDSELLQAQLLQPININPVQSRLASDGLSFLDNFGPGGVSFNEFTPLFERNGWRLVADGLVGTQRTWADDVALSTIHNNLSASVSQFHFQTEGFRENNDRTANIYDGFAQYAFNDRTSVQVEFRSLERERGDNQLFFHEFFSPTNRETFKFQTERVGVRHEFAPGYILLGSYIHRSQELSNTDLPFFSDQARDAADFGEVRQIAQGEGWALTFGGGIFRSTGEGATTIFFPPFGCTPCVDPYSKATRHDNAYAYLNLDLHPSLTTTVGVSWDSFDNGTFQSRSQVNPKLGLVWTPWEGSVFRAAALRTLKRQVISSQTIEPTEVAGFNQFFDDINATSAWLYGVGFDQKMSARLYTGMQFTRRDFDSPITGPGIFLPMRLDVLRAYANWVHSDRWTMTLGYTWEGFSSGGPTLPQPMNPNTAMEISTHKVPLEARYFDPSGFYARGRLTWVSQSGIFLDPSGMGVAPGSSQFVTVDAGVGYRLPNRRGMISLDVTNLFDQHFQFQDTDPRNAQIVGQRQIMGRLALVF